MSGLRGQSMTNVRWDIRNEGRSWVKGEATERYFLTPEKLEMTHGKLLSSDHEREMLLGLLLENVGADRAVRIGNPAIWRAAVDKLGQ